MIGAESGVPAGFADGVTDTPQRTIDAQED
jgi:hypothetical protein